MNKRADHFCRSLNEFFEKENVPLRIDHFGSLFKFESFGKFHLFLEPIEMNLFFHILLDKGVYTWERHICFISTAHTDEDVESVIRAIRETILEMKENGFWGGEQSGQKKNSFDKIMADTLSLSPPYVYPMSSAQKRIFFLDKLDGGQSSYRISAAMLIKGEPDKKRSEQVFTEIVKRHDALRTSFKMKDGELIQHVHDSVDFHIAYIEGSDDKIDDIIREFISKPFDLSKAPLFRIGLAKLSSPKTLRVSGDYLLILDSHHIAVDGMSLTIITKELNSLYAGEPLPPLKKQYRDFVLWQLEELQSQRAKEDEAYWVEKFSGEIPVLQLPSDYPRPLYRNSAGGVLYSELSEDRTSDLKTLAKRSSVTLNMLLFAAYNLLLYKLTGQEDIVVGLPVSGRPEDFEDVPGMFANTIAMRNQPKGDQTFSDFLKDVKKNSFRDYDHQNYPFELLVEKLNLQRDMSRNALFDTTFVYEKADERVFKIRDMVITPYNIRQETSQADISIETIEQEDKINLMFEYSSQLFREETMMRWLGYYEKILHEIIRNPNQRPGDIDIISEAEKHRLIVEFNDTEADFPEDKTVIDLFEEQAKKTPDNIAVIYPKKFEGFQSLQSLTSGMQDSLTKNLQSLTTGMQDSLLKNLQGLTTGIQDSLQGLTTGIQNSLAKNLQGLKDVCLTYRELNEKADQVADYLRKEYKIQPEDRVGLLLDRSEQMVIGALGIMKSGGAYVPADVLYPPDRIRHILENSNCKVILTEKSARDAKITKDINIPVVDIREIGREESGVRSQQQPTVRLSSPKSANNRQPTANNLAYVIYTSGSTGLPKGVMVEHRNLVNMAGAYRKAYGLDTFEVRLLQLASMSFDVFAGDMLRALMNGGQMIICPTETRIDIAGLYRLMSQYRISIFESTPALILPLTDYIYENNLDISFLKVLITSSDSIQAKHYRQLTERFGKTGMRIINTFGITEATIDSSYFEESNPDNITVAITPIGRPLLQNTYFYILDKYQKIQPIGVPGELYIGGAGVARGYLNNDALTAERFIPNPFRQGERMYKTGDIARCLSNGNTEYFGRMDNQVQIRGYRVELEEIEKQILKHEAVKEAVVLARGTEEGSTDLVAYIVVAAADSCDISVSDLRTYLSQFLPDYMIPRIFYFSQRISSYA